jgi:hypothetical protein
MGRILFVAKRPRRQLNQSHPPSDAIKYGPENSSCREAPSRPIIRATIPSIRSLLFSWTVSSCARRRFRAISSTPSSGVPLVVVRRICLSGSSRTFDVKCDFHARLNRFRLRPVQEAVFRLAEWPSGTKPRREMLDRHVEWLVRFEPVFVCWAERHKHLEPFVAELNEAPQVRLWTFLHSPKQHDLATRAVNRPRSEGVEYWKVAKVSASPLHEPVNCAATLLHFRRRANRTRHFY